MTSFAYILPCPFTLQYLLPTLQCNHSDVLVRTTNPFRQLLPKGKIFPFAKESTFPFRKNYPLSEDAKFKLLLGMSLVFCASRNIPFNDDNQILKFFSEGFKIYRQVIFLIPKICYQVLSSTRGCFIRPVWEVSFRYSQ